MSKVVITEENVQVTVSAASIEGPAGPAGEGVPAGGTTGQALVKNSNADYDTKWATGGGGGSDDQTAAEVPFTPAGNVAATDVQAAIQELDSEKAAVSHTHSGADITSGTVADARIASTIARDNEVTAAVSASEAGQVRDGDAAGGVLSGTYPDPGFAADMATQAELDAHVNDATAAHAASAISYAGGTGMSATDVEAAVDELATEKANAADVPTNATFNSHASRHADGGADEITAALDPRTYPMLAGALSSRPAAGVAGRFYWTTDEHILYRDSGSAWAKVAVADYADLDSIPSSFAPSAHASSHQDGGSDEISIQGLAGTPAELTNHLNDTTDAHDASSIANVPAGGIAATDVQAALNELDSEKADAASTVILAPASSARNVIQPTGGTPLIVRAKSGQTDNLFQIEDSAASALIAVDSSGNMTLGQGTTGVNLKVIGVTPLQVCANDGSESSWFKVGPSGVVRFNQGGGYTLCATASQTNTARMNIGTFSAVSCALAITGVSGQSGDLISVHPTTGSSTKYLRVNKGGYLMIRKTSAPADADLDSSEVAFWLDDSTGATKIMFKAKDSAGTVKTGSVTLT